LKLHGSAVFELFFLEQEHPFGWIKHSFIPGREKMTNI
jgi:hypothetical protein